MHHYGTSERGLERASTDASPADTDGERAQLQAVLFGIKQYHQFTFGKRMEQTCSLLTTGTLWSLLFLGGILFGEHLDEKSDPESEGSLFQDLVNLDTLFSENRPLCTVAEFRLLRTKWESEHKISSLDEHKITGKQSQQ